MKELHHPLMSGAILIADRVPPIATTVDGVSKFTLTIVATCFLPDHINFIVQVNVVDVGSPSPVNFVDQCHGFSPSERDFFRGRRRNCNRPGFVIVIIVCLRVRHLRTMIERVRLPRIEGSQEPSPLGKLFADITGEFTASFSFGGECHNYFPSLSLTPWVDL
jgi:hypothetical protein